MLLFAFRNTLYATLYQSFWLVDWCLGADPVIHRSMDADCDAATSPH